MACTVQSALWKSCIGAIHTLPDFVHIYLGLIPMASIQIAQTIDGRATMKINPLHLGLSPF